MRIASTRYRRPVWQWLTPEGWAALVAAAGTIALTAFALVGI